MKSGSLLKQPCFFWLMAQLSVFYSALQDAAAQGLSGYANYELVTPSNLRVDGCKFLTGFGGYQTLRQLRLLVFFPWFFEGFIPGAGFFPLTVLDYPYFFGGGDETWCKSNGNPCGISPSPISALFGARCHIMTPCFRTTFESLILVNDLISKWCTAARPPPFPEAKQNPKVRFPCWTFLGFGELLLWGFVADVDVRYFETCCGRKKSCTTWDA